MKVTIELPNIPGYEDTGEYRVPERMEPYRNPDDLSIVTRTNCPPSNPRFILHPSDFTCPYCGEFLNMSETPDGYYWECDYGPCQATGPLRKTGAEVVESADLLTYERMEYELNRLYIDDEYFERIAFRKGFETAKKIVRGQDTGGKYKSYKRRGK